MIFVLLKRVAGFSWLSNISKVTHPLGPIHMVRVASIVHSWVQQNGILRPLHKKHFRKTNLQTRKHQKTPFIEKGKQPTKAPIRGTCSQVPSPWDNSSNWPDQRKRHKTHPGVEKWNGLVLSYHISPSQNQFKCGESKGNLSTIAFVWVGENSSFPRKYRYNDTCMFNHFLNGISTVMSGY